MYMFTIYEIGSLKKDPIFFDSITKFSNTISYIINVKDKSFEVRLDTKAISSQPG